MPEPHLQEAIEHLRARRLHRIPAELEKAPRQACHLHRIERREHPLHGRAARTRRGRQQRFAQRTQMQQDRAALEDGDVAIGQPRHLPERLVREMVRAPIHERDARDAIR